jgi:uncharacterized protein (TIGR02246 family)
MREVRCATLCCGVLVLIAQQMTAQAPSDMASVTGFYNEWFSEATKSADAYASFYAADGVILPPGRPPESGRAAIAEWQRESQAAAPYTTRPEGVAVDETRFLTPALVVRRSTLRGQRIAHATNASTPFETKYFDVLRRSAEGRWEVVYRMWSDNR